MFKLNHSEAHLLHYNEMNAIKGGRTCGCACRAASTGGPSTADTSNANKSGVPVIDKNVTESEEVVVVDLP